jgi:hypothetical protein
MASLPVHEDVLVAAEQRAAQEAGVEVVVVEVEHAGACVEGRAARPRRRRAQVAEANADVFRSLKAGGEAMALLHFLVRPRWVPLLLAVSRAGQGREGDGGGGMMLRSGGRDL